MLGPDPKKLYPVSLRLSFYEVNALRHVVQQMIDHPRLQSQIYAVLQDNGWLDDWDLYPDMRVQPPPQPVTKDDVLKNRVLFFLIVVQIVFGFWMFLM